MAKSKLLTEFKEFALKGNVVDMAVGVVIGSSFGAIVTSIVNDIFTPLIAAIIGDVDFTNLAITLRKTVDEATGEVSKVTLNYGNFLQVVLNFVIVALCLFAVIKTMNKLKKPAPEAPKPEPRLCPFCFGEINEKATRCPHCTSKLD